MRVIPPRADSGLVSNCVEPADITDARREVNLLAESTEWRQTSKCRSSQRGSDVLSNRDAPGTRRSRESLT
jgi:hypothetical protein